MAKTKNATDGRPSPEAPRYVYLTRPRCPECGGVRLLAYATRSNGDGSRTRYAKCGDCGARVVLVVE